MTSSLFSKTRRARRQNPKHAHYERLRSFREDWVLAGGTRASLRKARKATGKLFPRRLVNYMQQATGD